MQCIKKASTLRVGPKGEKMTPRIVYREGLEDGQIAGFIAHRNLIKRIMNKHTLETPRAYDGKELLFIKKD